MSLTRLATAFTLAGAAALSGCAAYVTPSGRVGVGISAPVYVAPAYPTYNAPVYVAPAPRYYVAPPPRVYYPQRPYYGPRHGHW
jgi:hypothetical protein